MSVCLVLLRHTTSTFSCFKTHLLLSSLTFIELHPTTFPSATSLKQLVIKSLFLCFLCVLFTFHICIVPAKLWIKTGNLLSTSLTSELSLDQDLGAGANLLPTRSYVLLASRHFEGQPAPMTDRNVMRFHSARQTFGLAGLANVLKPI